MKVLIAIMPEGQKVPLALNLKMLMGIDTLNQEISVLVLMPITAHDGASQLRDQKLKFERDC